MATGTGRAIEICGSIGAFGGRRPVGPTCALICCSSFGIRTLVFISAAAVLRKNTTARFRVAAKTDNVAKALRPSPSRSPAQLRSVTRRSTAPNEYLPCPRRSTSPCTPNWHFGPRVAQPAPLRLMARLASISAVRQRPRRRSPLHASRSLGSDEIAGSRERPCTWLAVISMRSGRSRSRDRRLRHRDHARPEPCDHFLNRATALMEKREERSCAVRFRPRHRTRPDGLTHVWAAHAYYQKGLYPLSQTMTQRIGWTRTTQRLWRRRCKRTGRPVWSRRRRLRPPHRD